MASTRAARAARPGSTAAQGEAPVPAIVMAHGLSGTRRDRLGPFAERFAAAGFAALVFDHRGFGDSGGEPDLFHPRRQLEDWRAAIAFARSLPGVDPDRVATFGSSMGGGNALAAAAADAGSPPPSARCPSSTSSPRRTAPRPGSSPGCWAPRPRGRPPPGRRPAATRPPSSTRPGGEAGWRRVVAMGEDSRWRNRVSSRWLLGRPVPPRPPRGQAALPLARLRRRGRPGGPPGAGDRRGAPGAPQGELRLYPGVDHFDIYDGPAHEAVVADQVAFLRATSVG